MFGGLPAWEQIPDIGLYMDQVLIYMEMSLGGALATGEITRSMVNNYVKSGLLPRPAKKKYDREHLAMLLMIAVLKQALSMEHIARLLSLVLVRGTEAGYTRFLREIAALEENVSRGQIELSPAEDEPELHALRTAVSAAVCTVRAGRLLDAMAQTENAEKGKQK